MDTSLESHVLVLKVRTLRLILAPLALVRIHVSFPYCVWSALIARVSLMESCTFPS